MDADLLAQMATEKLIEDESLRGDLTDWEYQPLLDWALARVARCAEAAAATEDPRAHLDACVAGLRQIVRAAAPAVSEQNASAVAEVLSAPAVDAADLNATRERLARLALSDDKETNARRIVDALTIGQETP